MMFCNLSVETIEDRPEHINEPSTSLTSTSCQPNSSSSLSSDLNPVSTTIMMPQEKETKQCWVCLQSEDEKGADNDWVRPCRCRGSSMYVHQSCVQMWIDEKQKYSSGAKVCCPTCQTEYVLVLPPLRGIVHLLSMCDVFLYQAAPFACGTMFLSSIYWLSLSYGAITVLQVMGLPEGKEALQKSNTLWLLTGLPCIPIALIAGKFFCWEQYILQFWRRHHRSIPFIDKISPRQRERSERLLNNRDISHPVSCTRLFTGALMLPTVASIIGRNLFPNIASNLQRTLLGGFSFIVVKGLLKICLRHQQYIRQSNRKIMDFTENTPSQSEKNHSSTQTESNDTMS